MKKLLLLLLLSLSFTGSTYADAICKDGWKSTSEGSGTCSWHLGICEKKPNYTYNVYSNDYNPSHNHGYNQCPSRGASDFYFNPLNVEVSTQYGYTNAPMLGAAAGYGGMVSALGQLAGFQVQDEEGSVINDIANAIAEGIANDKSSNTRSYSSGSNNQTSSNPYLPPVIKNSLRNTPFYNVDTTYERYKDASFYGSDGIICTFFNDKEFNCNNGVSYYFGPTKVHGSDGTSYTSNWGNGGNDNYYCVTSSFGSKCCGNWASKSCTKVAKPVPENATAQKEYIQKKEDKPKVADKTTSSTLKSESKTTKKQTTLGFSGLSDLLGFLLLLSFLGLVFWRIFKPLKRLYKSLTRRRK